MRTLSTISELRNALAPLRKQDKTIGFVPTMGALHDGHLSLVRMSRTKCDITVVSIFVNPTQFGPNEDFDKYPRTLEEDASRLIEVDVDFLFLPQASEIYPPGHSTVVHVSSITSRFEGMIRPGHFDGVATVVTSLLNIVGPDIAFFGQKDAQQVAVVRRLVTDLHLQVDIQVGETVRENGKLALSSRNRYLSDPDRTESQALSAALSSARESLLLGEHPDRARQAGIRTFETIAPHGKLDYLDIVDSETFHPVTSFDPASKRTEQPITIVIAARFGETRLIDNIVVS